jgi:hypothetical protein
MCSHLSTFIVVLTFTAFPYLTDLASYDELNGGLFPTEVVSLLDTDDSESDHMASGGGHPTAILLPQPLNHHCASVCRLARELLSKDTGSIAGGSAIPRAPPVLASR